MAQDPQKRLAWMDISRGLVILAVVHVHVLNGMESYYKLQPDAYFEYVRAVLRSFYMPFFFFLSGMMVKSSLAKRAKFRFMADKAKTILYPYFVWVLLMASVRILFPNMVNNPMKVTDLLVGMFLVPINHMWFLYALFWYFILYAILEKVPSLFAGVMLAIASCSVIIGFESFEVNQMCYNGLFFASGMLLVKHVLNLVEKSPWWMILVGFALGALRQDFVVDQNGITRFIFVIPLVLAVCMSANYVNEMGWLGRSLAFAGKRSLYIYLAHPFAYVFSRLLLSRVFGVDNLVVHVVIGTLLGVLLPLLLWATCKTLRFPYLFSMKPLN